uniref:EF-hand domain-containing protein n=1 Tax=Fundulus heteroclitus TaxID=8078 RepID=A0A3Q2SXI7_FUNHE
GCLVQTGVWSEGGGGLTVVHLKQTCGFKLNNKLYQMLIARYADNEIIDFDNFTCCLVKLETMFKTFQGLDRDRTGTVEVNLAEVPNSASLCLCCGNLKSVFVLFVYFS